jgi:hypothetical protein
VIIIPAAPEKPTFNRRMTFCISVKYSSSVGLKTTIDSEYIMQMGLLNVIKKPELFLLFRSKEPNHSLATVLFYEK